MTDNKDVEGRIKMATVSAPDVDATVKSYQDYFGYQVIEDSIVSDAQAAAWGTPGMAGKRQVITGPASGTTVYIRVIENDPVDEYEPMKTYGWNAIEITIQDVEELDRQLQDSPFEIVGPPAMLDFSDKIYPMQAVGLSKELFYLNEVRGSLPDYDLPMAQSFVDQIFIMILATPDMQKAIDFYTTNFGWDQGNAYFVKYSVINNAFDLPEETPHHLSMTCVGRVVNNEVDQYPEGTIERPCKDGMLAPGIALTSFIVSDLDKIDVPFIGGIQTFEGVPYNGRRSACCIGNAGELIELIEA